MQMTGNIAQARGLPDKERADMTRLLTIWQEHQSKNALKKRYYEGHISLREVNLGLALPKGIAGLEIGCAWGEKCVDVLASRSMFDGYVGRDGEAADTMSRIMTANRLQSEYMKACRDELKYGCTFATLSADKELGCRIRFHSPETAAAEWDGEKGRLGCGFAVIDTVHDVHEQLDRPSLICLHTDTDIWLLRRGRDDGDWTAARYPHHMGRPLMEPLVWNATSGKPFGRSRLKEPIRRLIQGYVRTVANAAIGLEFSTAPQKYMIGISDDQYDAVMDDKFRLYVGAILAATQNPDTGEKPTFGQFQQGNIEPHVQMLRMLATQFSAATGLSTVDVGVINDANPMSADAINAQNQTLVLMAEQLNAGNGNSLNAIAQMAQAIARNVTPDELTDEERDVMAHFRNPSMPSVSSMADAALKIASMRSGFAGTDVFLEMTGFDQADIRRIKAQEQRQRGMDVLSELLNEESEDENRQSDMGDLSEQA